MKFPKWSFGKGNEKADENQAQSNELPDHPEMLMSMAERIVHIHVARGAESPVGEGMITALSVKLKTAREKHEEGMTYLKLASEAMKSRVVILGLINPY